MGHDLPSNIIPAGVEEPAPIEVKQATEETPRSVRTTEQARTMVPVLSDSSAKTYMSVHAITDTTSDQYKYIHESGEVKTDERGFLICGTDYIGVALGFYFGEIGEKYIFTLSTGEELKVCKVEHKAPQDTRPDQFAAHDNHVIEFVVDTQTEHMQENVWENGYIYGGNFNNCPEFDGTIVKIEKVEE